MTDDRSAPDPLTSSTPPGAPSGAGFGFPKSVRVRRTVDYKRIQGRGQKLRTRHLLVLFTRGRAPASRFGLTVSRKVGNAVRRNEVKRWLRESIRHRRADLQGRWDVVFIATPRAARAGFDALDRDIEEAIRKIPRERQPRRRS